MKIRTMVVLIGAASALTACINSQPRPIAVAANPTAPTGVEGNWVDPNGIVSTFQAGNFTTRTTDTNQMLASGTYTNVSPSLVEINVTSLLRKTQSRVNCALVSPQQLNCTPDNGPQFSLSRRG